MIEFFKDIGSLIMDPLYFVTSFILTTFHELFSGWFGGSDPGQGWAWALSIVCLTIVIRILLIPLFVKQIKSSRNMQLLQPKVKELQKKYGHDRERLSRETMALYKETGTNPFASCLPLILQMPIFLALFRLISRAATEGFGGEHFMTVAGRGVAADRDDLRRADLRPVLGCDRHQHPDSGCGAGAGDDGDDVPDAAAADEQEHAG